jgi:hypothetical protein
VPGADIFAFVLALDAPGQNREQHDPANQKEDMRAQWRPALGLFAFDERAVY